LNEIVPLRNATWFRRERISSAEIAAGSAKSARARRNALAIAAFLGFIRTCTLGHGFIDIRKVQYNFRY
jgi:hypothetical protein